MTAILSINVVRPVEGGTVDLKNGGVEVVIQVTLSCGMPTCSGGRFDPRGFQVRARAFREGGDCEAETGLEPTNFVSEFRGVLSGLKPGVYEVEIEAQDTASGLAGRGWVRFRVPPSA